MVQLFCQFDRSIGCCMGGCAQEKQLHKTQMQDKINSLVILELSYKAQHAGLHNLSLDAANTPF